MQSRISKKKIQLNSKLSIKDLLTDLLKETEGFKYQITINVTLTKCKITETEFRPVYFNSTTKAMINHKFSLENLFYRNFVQDW